MLFDRPNLPSWTKHEFEIVRYPIPRKSFCPYSLAAFLSMLAIFLVAYGFLFKAVMS